MAISDSLFRFLRDEVAVLMAPCLRKCWTRKTRAAGMRREAERMLEELDRCNARIDRGPGEQTHRWDELMGRLKRAVEKW